MKIISCRYIYKDTKYIKNSAIAFDKLIKEIDTLENLKQKYPDAQIIEHEGNTVLYPGFINPHTHLEFSANGATLNYGNFIEWLYSVIKYREELVHKLSDELIKQKAKEMLASGVTTFGAISSFGAELEACSKLEQRVIFFNEIIGSNPAAVDTLFNDFKTRLQESIDAKSETLIPAVAIHSPYSVHPFLMREVLKIAKEQNLITTAHFLESPAEREWLESASGDFATFFKDFANTTTPVTNIQEFLNAFNNQPTLFTHATQANAQDIEYINKYKHSIIHCPRSNRLLGCGKLDISNIDNLLLGTDGLSSNYSLSILDELKTALFMHTNYNPKELSLKLIQSVTKNAQKALNLKIGKLKPTFYADFALFKLPDDLKNEEDGNLALHTIINCTKAKEVYIGGEKVFKG